MKKRKLIFNIIGFLFSIFVFGFTSCKMEEANLISMTLVENCPDEFVIGCFDTTKYSFVLTYKDGTTKTIELTEDMISESDMLKTYRDGTHTLTATYLNMTCDITVTAKRYEFSQVVMEDKEYTYSGSSYALTIDGALPEGTNIIYPNGNQFVEAGTYIVKATLVNDYYVTKTIEATLKIKPAVYDMSNIKFEDATYTYDGYPKSISVIGDIPKGLTVTYSIGKAETNSMIEASDTPYVVTAHFDAGSNYEPIEDKKALLTINKATYDMSNIKFEDSTYTYDGKSHSIVIDSKLPSGVSVSYEGNNQTSAGKYEVTANFTGDVTNYYPISSLKAKMTIEKANMDLTTIYMDNATFTYDKMPHYIDYYGELPDGISFVRTAYYEVEEDGTLIGEVDSMINVGFYDVKSYFVYTKEDKNNYNSLEPITARAEITKADIDFITFSEAVFEYDGFAHSIFVDGDIPDGLKVTYTNNAQVEVGKYTVSATFSFVSDSLAKRNYNNLSSMTALMRIDKAKIGTNIEDFTYEYAGSDKAYSLVISDWEVNEETLGKIITPKVGDEEIIEDAIYESLPDGVSIYFTTKVDGVESEFVSTTNPGQVLLNAVYYSKTLDSANDFLSHYITGKTSATKSNVTIGGVKQDVYILGSKSVLFNVTKRHYVPTFVNETIEIADSGFGIPVYIDVTNDLANNPSLSFASGYETTGGIYKNIVNNKVGIYTATVEIKLSEDAKNYYYDFSEPYVFKYAIKNKYVDEDNDGRIVYDPGISQVIKETYDESKDEYAIDIPTNIPSGMTISFDYSKELTKPGSTVVKVVVDFDYETGTNISDGELANYYYKLPSCYSYNKATGKYTMFVSYTVEKKTYTPTFSANFEYDGSAKLPTAIDLPSWITISYQDEQGNVVSLEKNPISTPSATPYNLYAFLEINSDAMAEYYQVSDKGILVEMTIDKGYFTNYKVSGEKVKYDGKPHNIIITGLPDGITYTTTLGNPDDGVIDVGVYEDVIVYFHNNSEYYNDLKNLKLTLTIENNYVEMGRIQSYCRTTGSKDIKQFSSLKEVLSEYINLDGATLDWECHYYNGSEMYDYSYTSRHGSSKESDDFIFSESTNDNDVCVCEFTIKLKNGYVFYEDSSINEYSASINFSISNTIKVSIDSLEPISNKNTIEVEQLSTLPELIATYTPVELGNNYTITAWSANYYDLITPYPDSYKEAHLDENNIKTTLTENDYTFRLNTWGNRYCLVSYTITTSDDYCFFVNGISYKTYTGEVKCLVNKNVKEIDDTFLISALVNDGQDFEVNKNTYFEKYLGALIDTNYVDIDATLFNKEKEALEKEDGMYNLIYSDASDYEDMSANISISLKNGYSFKNSEETSYSYKNVNLLFDDDQVIDILGKMSLAITKSNEHRFEFEQFIQPGAAMIRTGLLDEIFENTDYSFVATYPDGTTLTGSNSYSITLDKITEGEEEATIVWTYIPHEGYCVLSHGTTGERLDKFELTLNFKVRSSQLVDTSDLTEFISDVKEVDQYTDIADDKTNDKTINDIINDIKDIAGDVLYVSYEGAYYKGTEKVDSSASITGNSTISTILPLSTDVDADYYVLHVKLSLANQQNALAVTGFSFDTLEKDYEFTLRYKVNKVEAFDDKVLKSLMSGDPIEYSQEDSILLQTLIYNEIQSKYTLNDNIEFVSYEDTYTFFDQTPCTFEGSLSEPYYLYGPIQHNITIKLKASDGTCMLDENGKAITEFEIHMTVSITSVG